MKFETLDLGLMAYAECTIRQREILEQVAAGEKLSTLIFVQHPPVLTLGANFHSANLLHPLAAYEKMGIEVLQTDRGGDVTYHGPGQLVIHPIFDLRPLGQDLHLWLRQLEEVVIQSIASVGVFGHRFAPHTGVWVDNEKIAAIGIKVRRWVSMHGIALNCDIDLAPFETIIPCGIEGFGVTSLTKVVGRPVSPEEMKPAVESAFRSLCI